MGRRIRDEATFQIFLAYITEIGLEQEIRSVCLKYFVTLRDIYLDVRGPSVHAARLEVWFWMSYRYRKSNGEIGVLFNREGNSVMHALRKVKEKSLQYGMQLPDDITEITKRMAAEARGNMVRMSEARAAAYSRGGKSSDGGDH